VNLMSKAAPVADLATRELPILVTAARRPMSLAGMARGSPST
jgi:hypothetical protein